MTQEIKDHIVEQVRMALQAFDELSTTRKNEKITAEGYEEVAKAADMLHYAVDYLAFTSVEGYVHHWHKIFQDEYFESYKYKDYAFKYRKKFKDCDFLDRLFNLDEEL